MRTFFNVILQLVAAVLVVLLFTAVWIVFDGLTDLGEKADIALVYSRPDGLEGTSRPLLDHVVQIYNDGEFPLIVVSAATGAERHSETGAIVKYLLGHGIASSAIIEDHGGGNIPETARNMADIMRSRRLHSVMVVSDYYYVTRLKLALYHEGISEIQKTHIGKMQEADAGKVWGEMVSIYDFVYEIYILPAVEKIKKEAQTGMGKFNSDAKKAKDKVNKGLDGLSK